jgi:hypothetical protein
MKGLARRNTHVKYESPSTNQSRVIFNEVFADGQRDRQSDYYWAPAISGALKMKTHVHTFQYETGKRLGYFFFQSR